MRLMPPQVRRGLCLVLIASVLGATLAPRAADAGEYWFSGPVDPHPTRKSLRTQLVPWTAAAGSAQLFDVVVSLHDNPAGDDDGNTQNVDPGSAAQDNVERILQHFADGVYESTEGAHKLRKIRIFRNKKKHDKADIIWEPKDRPYANLNGITDSGLHIYMFDDFDGDQLRADEIGAGYTLAHEWGHYAYGLKDEYFKQTGDVPVVPSIMNSQWSARDEATGTLVDARWLNFSIAFQSDPPGAFQNTKRNLQHRRYGASGWEVLARKPSFFDRLRALFFIEPLRVFYPTLAAVAPSGTNVPSFPDLPGDARSDLDIIWMKNDLTYEIVIDRSGSMSGTKIENAKTAAKLLVDLAQEGTTTVGVIAFSSGPATVVPLTPLTDQTAKDNVKAAIDTISAGGGTAVGAAAQAALDALLAGGTDDDTKVVFLLSDGLSGDDALAPVPAYVANQIPILAFSYGDDADTATLGQMATATRGKLFVSPVSLAQVSQAFQEANSLAAGQASVASGSGSLVPGNPSSVPVRVDTTMSRLDLAVTHQGGAGAASFELVAPDGTRHAPASISPSGGETLSLFSVDNPAPGAWTLEGTAGAAGPFHYQVSADPVGDTYTLSTRSAFGDVLRYPQPLVLTAALGKQLPISGATVTAVITAPDGTERTVQLLDDGVTPDEIAHDGRYGAVLICDQSGVYDVIVRAEAAAGVAQLTARGLELSLGADGSPVPASPDQPVAEAFQRFDRFQITVEGVSADDHGNTPAAATPIVDLNDAPLPGRIERGGDVDVFSLETPAGATEVAVRVTGLALRMSPFLRILASDGTTVLAEGTLPTSRSEGGYLALKVPAAPGTTLYAEVRHNNGASGTGLYQIGAGAVIDSDQPASGPGTQSDVVGTLQAAGTFAPGSRVTYTLVLSNRGAGQQEDRPGPELINVLPQDLELLSVRADSGMAAADVATNSVTWNGSVPSQGAVNIVIEAMIRPGTLGRTVASQAEVAYDGDGLGVNWSTRLTDDPELPGTEDPTTFVVGQQEAAEIPTVSEVGLAILCLLLAGLGLVSLRRRQA